MVVRDMGPLSLMESTNIIFLVSCFPCVMWICNNIKCVLHRLWSRGLGGGELQYEQQATT